MPATSNRRILIVAVVVAAVASLASSAYAGPLMSAGTLSAGQRAALEISPGSLAANTGASTAHATDVTPYEWYIKELTIHSPRAARPRDCDSAIELCAQHRLDLAQLVTARFPLARLADALAATRDPAQLKVVINVAL